MINKNFPNYSKYKQVTFPQVIKFEEQLNRLQRRKLGKKEGRKINAINKPYIKDETIKSM